MKIAELFAATYTADNVIQNSRLALSRGSLKYLHTYGLVSTSAAASGSNADVAMIEAAVTDRLRDGVAGPTLGAGEEALDLNVRVSYRHLSRILCEDPTISVSTTTIKLTLTQTK